MDCAACGESLWEYVRGELPPQEAARVETHLGGCAGCRAEAEAVRRTCAFVRRQPIPEPPAGIPETLRERVRTTCVTVVEQAEACRLLAGAWEDADGAAAALRRAASGATGVRLARVLLDLAEAAGPGGTLAEALGRRPYLFWPPIVALARRGEASGKLPEMLARLAGILEGELALRREVIAGTDRPAFVALGVGAGAGLLAELRHRSRVSRWRAALLGTVSAGGTLAALTLRREMRRGVRAPWLRRASRQVSGLRGPERLATWADAAAAIAGTAALGLPPAEVLGSAAGAVDDPEVCAALRSAAESAGRAGLAGALRSARGIPLAFAEAAALGEDSGEPDALFGALAAEYREEIARDAGRVAAWARPALFAVGGAFLGAAAGAIFRQAMHPKGTSGAHAAIKGVEPCPAP